MSFARQCSRFAFVPGFLVVALLLSAATASAMTFQSFPRHDCRLDGGDWRTAAGDTDATAAYVASKRDALASCPDMPLQWVSTYAAWTLEHPEQAPTAVAALMGEHPDEDAPDPAFHMKSPVVSTVKGTVGDTVFPDSHDASDTNACAKTCTTILPTGLRSGHGAGAPAQHMDARATAAAPGIEPTPSTTASPPSNPSAESASVNAARAIIVADTQAALTVGVAIAAATAAAVAGTLGAFSAYSRIQRARTLDHPLRSRVYETLQQDPGRTPQELANATGIDLDTIRYHLRRLERADLIAARRIGRRARYYIPGHEVNLVEKEVTAVPIAQRVVEAVQSTPGISLAEISRRVGGRPSLCHYHVQKLLRADLLVAEGEGLHRVYKPAT